MMLSGMFIADITALGLLKVNWNVSERNRQLCVSNQYVLEVENPVDLFAHTHENLTIPETSIKAHQIRNRDEHKVENPCRSASINNQSSSKRL